MDPTYNSTSEGNGSALTEYNYLVTSSATASASSTVSQADANTLSQNLANQVAQSVATNDSNIINQTLDIVNKEFIQPITSPNNIRIDQVVDSLNAFKYAFYKVNYLANLVNKNAQAIIDAGQYASVLKPIVELDYYNNTDYFWIYSIDLTNPANYIDYFDWKEFYVWTGLTYPEIVQYNNENNLSFYNPLLLLLQTQSITFLNQLLTLYPDNNIYTYLFINEWNTGLQLTYTQYQKDLLNPNQWISISSVIDLAPYLPNTNNIALFSKQYLTFINAIANQISYLNGTDFAVPAIWPYINPVDYPSAQCLQSTLYPQWTGSLISECFIPGSDVDYPAIIQNEIVDLYGNYPPLVPGQIALLTYNLAGTYVVAFAKITTFVDPSNNTQQTPAFKQLGININGYFTEQLIIINDTVINGSLTVTDYRGDPIIETDNVSQITSFHKKIGVNQDTYNVKGLVDINNLSYTNIQNILNDFVNPMLYSADLTYILSPTITYGTTSVIIPPNVIFLNDNFVFKTPILNVIEPSNITFLYVPPSPNAFYTEKFTPTSFLRIQTIVNELNKMIPQIDLNSETQSYTFSFIELLNDTQNWYLCTLRGLIRTNPSDSNEKEVFFIGSFLNADSTMNSDSYTEAFISLTDQFSSCARLLNLSNLLVLNPEVYADLLQGNSIGSTDPNNLYFSDRINDNPYFRTRFGNPSLYIYCYDFIDLLQIKNNVPSYYLFNENWTYFNLNNSSDLYYPNKNYNAYSITKTLDSNFIQSYGIPPLGSFIVNYSFVDGAKISIVNILTIGGKTYLIGTGFNLGDYISESIILKGDNLVTGNFSIVDSDTNNEVFAVNTAKNQSYSLYNLGIGTNNPENKVTINACGLTNIINSVNALSVQLNNIYNNFPLLVTAPADASFGEIIENDFLNYNLLDASGNPTKFVQTDHFYFSVLARDVFQISPESGKTIMVYNWYYPEWNGKSLNAIQDDPQYTTQATNIIDTQSTASLNNYVYPGLAFSYRVNSVYGVKGSFGLLFVKNQKLNFLNTGVDLSPLGNDFNDPNVVTFYNTISSYFLDLQYVDISLNKIPTNRILNYEIIRNNQIKYLQSYPIQESLEYTYNLNDINTMIISQYNYQTLEAYDPVAYKDLIDQNLITKYLFFFTQVNQYFNYFSRGKYGIVTFNDAFNSYVSCFWCKNYDVSNNTITLISLELQINTIILPNLSLKGDLVVEGNSYFSNVNQNRKYMIIDTVDSFVGVNTEQVFINYTNNSITTTNGTFSKQNMCVSSTSSPNFVAERYAETPIPSAFNYGFFREESASTLRRRSQFYTFEEMYYYSELFTTTNPPGVLNAFGSSINYYKYGASQAVQITDKSNLTRQIGNINMVIDSITVDPSTNFVDLKAGFGVTSIDLQPNSLDTTYRKLLYVDNNSQLYTNTYKVGGVNVLSSDPSGNLAIQPQDASGNVTGIGSINLAGPNGQSYVLSIDPSGNLLFNGKKVVVEP